MMTEVRKLFLLLACTLFVAACSSTPGVPGGKAAATARSNGEYLIGPGDSLQVFVWRNPDISVTVPVRPDGLISTPLVEDMTAVGKTPSRLARDIEERLAKYIRKPVVTVIVQKFVGPFSEQIRVIGEAARPQALPYRENMTVLDVMIEVGGLTEFAAGNRAKLVRNVNGKRQEYQIRLKDLIKDGKISENKVMQPGDILIIPESWF